MIKNIIKISYRNLLRNSRRTILTASLITLGVVFVLIYSALSSGFKAYMIGQITDSMMDISKYIKKAILHLLIIFL